MFLTDIDFYLKSGRELYIHGEEAATKDADFIVYGSLQLDKIVQAILDRIK